jgi:type III pantothenate kinase
MLLIIDVGNTNVVFGVYHDDKLIETFRLRTEKKYTVDEIGLCICQYFIFLKINKEDVKAVIISSIVPCLINTLKSSIKKYFSIEPLIIGENLKININNLYNNPQHTGVDRLINAVVAVKKYGVPCIIIDMGTATTFDAVNSNGEFMGGAIYPGINILTDILSKKTANLPEIELSKPITVIGKSTEECMQSGIYYGYLGAIEGILLNMKLKIGDCVKVIATGGLSKHLLEKNSNIDFIDENLTLEGIKFIYESQV